MKNPFENGNNMVYREENVRAKFSVEATMRSLDQDIAILLEKLRSGIDAKEYQIVLGVDGSGRIPALVLGKTIQNIYALSGQNGPEIRFAAGSRNLDQEKFENKVEQYIAYFRKSIAPFLEKGQKVLLVEDTIETGNSIKPIIEALRSLAIDFDIVTIGFQSHSYNSAELLQIEDVEASLGESIVYAREGMSDIYAHKKMSGVQKSSDDIVSTPISKGQANTPSREVLHTNQDILKRTRELVTYLAQERADSFVKGDSLSVLGT
jgi:adenine/guanine phosphoribosyltransferase-like PRPP-binding protein